jgi:signal transduction histidine kinase/CheY-like chemotaxis protein
MPFLFIGILILTLISNYLSSKPVFTDHAREIMVNVSSYTIDKSRSYLNPARDAALLTSGLAVNQIITSSDRDEMENYFHKQLQINSQFSNIYYGTVEGEFFMVSRQPSEGFLTKIISYTDGERTVLFKKSDESLNVLSRYRDDKDLYDPRVRPWYSKAVTEGKLVWTDPYVFFTSRNPGITTASPVYNSDGLLHGVVGVDIEIGELSDFISTLSIGKSGKAFILDGKGQVLAYPDKSKITHQPGESDSVSLVTIAELDDNISRAAYNSLKKMDYHINENEELFFTFEYENEIYHGMFTPFRVSYWPWLLGIYIPENDYIGTLKENRNFSGLLSFILGIVTILCGAWMARSILVPLDRIQKAVNHISSGNFQKPFSLKTYYREFDETIRAFELMRLGLVEKSLIEKQLQQQQKVESIGRLAGGVAHDLNNLLTPILGYSEILMHSLKSDEVKKLQVGQIFKAGSKAKNLVRQLLAFSRKQELEYNPVNLNTVVLGFEKLLKRTIREDIEIQIIESEIPPVILADPGQIEQVVLNLAVNAQDAMTDGGVLTIKISIQETGESFNTINPGKYVILSVSDTGCGMDEETEKHIYEPFFSTKGDFGIGLGLATVHGIVHQHEGEILVKSESGKGTMFNVYFPYCAESPEGEVEKKGLESSYRGCETILIAEDNKEVRDLTETVLKSLGYTVLVAENGLKALSILADYSSEVHLLLTDVIMPEMNGKDLYLKARLLHKRIQVIYMSGYSDNAIVHHNLMDREMPYIQKPYLNVDLARKIREILKGS